MPLETTVRAVGAILTADPSVTPLARNKFLSALRSGPEKCEIADERAARIVRRTEGASRLGISLRTFDKLCTQGVLKKRILPGRTRAAGVLESDLLALLNAKEVA